MSDKFFNQMASFGESLLKKASVKCGQAEVLVRGGVSTRVWFENGKLSSIEQQRKTDLGLRVINNGRLGITGSLKPSGEDDLIKEAEASAKESEKVKFSFPKPSSLKKVNIFSSEIVKIEVEKIIAEGKLAIEYLKEHLPQFNPQYVSVEWGNGNSVLLNNQGVNYSDRSTSLDLFILISRKQEGDFYDVYEDVTFCRREVNILNLAKRIEQRARWGSKIVNSGKLGNIPVIFPPEAVDTLLSYFSTAVNGRKVNDKSSRFVGKIGEKLFDSRLTLINSSLEDYKIGSSQFDDEGIAGRRQVLIDKGILKEFIFDLKEASKAGTESTGSGQRSSVFGGVDPSSANLMVLGGDRPWKNILKGINKGLLVYDFLGQGQGNVLNGDFSLNVAPGFLIDNGEIIGRVKGVGIAGNIFQLLKNNLVEFSKETEWHGSVSAPFIVLNGVSITKRE